MAKRPSLGHQFHQALESKKAIGQSRHEAKAEGTAHQGIYSYKTYDAYKNSSKQFAKWIKSEFPEVKYLSEIDRDMCKKYIKFREQSGCSAYTYSQDMAMISKTLDISLTKKECEVATRKLNNITKNKIDNGFRTESGAIELILRGTGLRRNELVNLKVKNLIVENNRAVGVLVRKGAKGGKVREVQVRKEYQEHIYKTVEGLDSDSKVISEEIPKQLQAHRYRAEYAQNMYKELVELGREDPLKDLTENMGHNRKSVLVYYGVDIKK
ncbi:phage integrase SAM-like domain-containing protein [Intestinibacter sp.]|uniref:phage integrase SAM-like domain-containing protein n=1 Tax=Intestinibacter sp. TaxID=1965304 RepID=UPI002A918D54|nr:phage integrase SAM-like domain-containing protein [Intestinibacter sp.]MDY5213063.1 phage integrase SAM-like domain-containing protein [Intestinibacter sp.]